MADDGLEILRLLPEKGSNRAGDIFVARPVEAVAADAVLLIVLLRQRIQIGLRGHGLMEGGIEYRHHRGVRHQSAARKDSGQICRIVQRCKIGDLTDALDHVIIDERRLRELLAAVHDAVSHRTDLGQRLHDAALRVRDGIENQADGLLMILDLGLRLDFPAMIADVLIGDGAVNADALAQALCKDAAVVGINDLKLQRRTAAVDHQNVHLSHLPYCAFAAFCA